MSDPAPEYNTLLGEIVQKWEDVLPLLKWIGSRFPKRKWPRGNERDQRNSLQCVDVLLDCISGGRRADILKDYLSATHRQDLRSEILRMGEHVSKEDLLDSLMQVYMA